MPGFRVNPHRILQAPSPRRSAAAIGASAVAVLAVVAASSMNAQAADATSSASSSAVPTVAANVIAPTAPTQLTADLPTTTTVVLHWSASTGGTGSLTYRIFRSGVLVGTSTSPAFRDSGLSPATTYAYSVQAVDEAGNVSAASAERSVTMPEHDLDWYMTDVTAPSKVTGLVVKATDASVVLTWYAATDNVGGLGVKDYLVYRDGIQIATVTSPSYTDTTVLPLTDYYYWVEARDFAGNVGSDGFAEVKTSRPTAIDPAEWYLVTNTNSGKCVDDADWSTRNGARLQQWDCASPATNNQLWQFQPTSDGYYRVASRHAAGLVWDVTGGAGATSNGVAVQLWAAAQGTNQQWLPVALGGGRFRFVARNSGKCLDVRDVSTRNGAGLQQWSCTGGPAQSFSLETVAIGSGRPAFATLDSRWRRTYVAWTGSSGTDNTKTVNLGVLNADASHVDKLPPLNETTLLNEGPALIDDGRYVGGGDSYTVTLAWASTDSTLRALYYAPQGVQCRTTFDGVKTLHSPALAHNNHWWATIAWVDLQNHINVADLDRSTCGTTGQMTLRSRVTLPETSSAGPSLAVDPVHPELGMLLAWTGTDAAHRVHIATYDRTATLTQRGTVDAPVGAQGGPSVVGTNVANYLAFRGTDGRGYFGSSSQVLPQAYAMHAAQFSGGLGSDIALAFGSRSGMGDASSANTGYFDAAGRLRVLPAIVQ